MINMKVTISIFITTHATHRANSILRFISQPNINVKSVEVVLQHNQNYDLGSFVSYHPQYIRGKYMGLSIWLGVENGINLLKLGS